MFPQLHENTENNILRDSEERYRLAIEQTGQLVYDYDFVSGTVKWVGAIEELTGYTDEEFSQVKVVEWNQFLHPEDRENAMQFLEASKRTGQRLHSVYRFLCKNGVYKIIEDIGVLIHNQEGVAYRIIGTMKDITEKKTAEEKLKALNGELETFMYKASHDLKGPVASLQGLLTLAKSLAADEELRKYMSLMEQSIQRLTDTLETLLNITRIKQGRVNLAKIDFKELSNRVFEDLKYAAGYEEVAWEVQISQETVFYSDIGLLQSILQNLLQNAVKYRKVGKKNNAKLNIEVDAYKAMIIVEDSGVGIPADMQDKVFQMFVRANDTTTGTGLGLYIVKNALEKLNATITLQSNEKIGSTFSVRLPNTTLY